MYNSIPISQHEYELTISSPWYTCCLFIILYKSIYYAHVSPFWMWILWDIPGRHGDSLSIILHNNVTVDPSPSGLGNTNIKNNFMVSWKPTLPSGRTLCSPTHVKIYIRVRKDNYFTGKCSDYAAPPTDIVHRTVHCWLSSPAYLPVWNGVF